MTSRLWIDDGDEDVTGDDENEEVCEGSGDASKKKAPKMEAMQGRKSREKTCTKLFEPLPVGSKMREQTGN
jgi:hypothetical protein